MYSIIIIENQILELYWGAAAKGFRVSAGSRGAVCGILVLPHIQEEENYLFIFCKPDPLSLPFKAHVSAPKFPFFCLVCFSFLQTLDL